MKKFDLVKVFEDPQSCQRQEGKARLITKHDQHMQGCERWDVRFKGEEGTYTREINLENH